MSETKQGHTPGPWLHDWSDECNYAVLAHNSGSTRIVAFIREDTDEDNANADLIAAAPDLLAALEKIERRVTQEADIAYGAGADGIAAALRETAQLATAAISKARGAA